MKIAVDVKMKAQFIYDLLLYHTYSKFSGFVINLVGLSVIVMGGFSLRAGRITMGQCAIYIAAGLCVLAFTPLNLKIQSKKMMKAPKYSDVIRYNFDEQGIEEVIGDKINSYAWSHVKKATATPKNIAFYVTDDSALIVPKESFGDNFMPVMKLIAENMSRERIYIH
jgi:hypothetical protein